MAKTITRMDMQYGCIFSYPLEHDVLEMAIRDCEFPDTAKTFYRYCNALKLDWFEVLPVEDPANIKGTWNGIWRLTIRKAAVF